MPYEINSGQDRILQKVNTFFNFSKYKNFLTLSMDVSLAKYGSYGFSFHNFLSVRFSEGPHIFNEICSLLPKGNYFLLPMGDHSDKIFQIEKKEITAFLEQSAFEDFIIMEEKTTWLLVYDHHRVLSDMGNYIKKKMRQNINLRLGDCRIMFSNTDETP